MFDAERCGRWSVDDERAPVAWRHARDGYSPLATPDDCPPLF